MFFLKKNHHQAEYQEATPYKHNDTVKIKKNYHPVAVAPVLSSKGPLTMKRGTTDPHVQDLYGAYSSSLKLVSCLIITRETM
jgi:hypothetical protein